MSQSKQVVEYYRVVLRVIPGTEAFLKWNELWTSKEFLSNSYSFCMMTTGLIIEEGLSKYSSLRLNDKFIFHRFYRLVDSLDNPVCIINIAAGHNERFNPCEFPDYEEINERHLNEHILVHNMKTKETSNG